MVETSLRFKPGFVPKTIGDFLDELSTIADGPEKMSRLDDFVIRLEEEKKKVDAFKRELPLCSLLLNDAISALKGSVRCEPAKAQPLLVEFLPVKRELIESDDSNIDKKNWMKPVQLWRSDDRLERDTKAENKRNENESRSAAMDMLPTRTERGEGKRIMPFKGGRKSDEEELPIQALSLLKADIKDRAEKSSPAAMPISSEKDESSSRPVSGNRLLGPKQRRCWSAELHKLFVKSLQTLGGAQVATPKQIRDLMQVDGLTNDEIKSHLQKYRLQSRRPSRTDESLGILGGLWRNQIEEERSSKVRRSHSGSPQGPLQLAATAKTAIGGGQSFEEDEDTKSDSFSRRTRSQRPGKDFIQH